jgi:hypothetical protein
MATLEDLDRRVTALERKAEHDRSVERAVAEIVAESERRMLGEMKHIREHVTAAEQRMTNRVDAVEHRITEVEQRLTSRVEASERRMVDVLNERFDAVMTAIDGLRP